MKATQLIPLDFSEAEARGIVLPIKPKATRSKSPPMARRVISLKHVKKP